MQDNKDILCTNPLHASNVIRCMDYFYDGWMHFLDLQKLYAMPL